MTGMGILFSRTCFELLFLICGGSCFQPLEQCPTSAAEALFAGAIVAGAYERMAL